MRASSPARADSRITGTSRSAGSSRSSPQQPEAVELRHHHVGDRMRSGAARSLRGERLGAVVHRLDRVASARAGRARRRACRRCRRRARCARRRLPRSAGRGRRREPRCVEQRREPASAPSSWSQRTASCDDTPAVRWPGRRRTAALPTPRRPAGARCRTAVARETCVPRPRSLCASIVPPCRRTSSCTSARPMPLPSWVRPCAPSTRWKRSNRRGSSAAAMPTPGIAHLEHRARRLARAAAPRRRPRT